MEVKLLIVDDEQSIAESLAKYFRLHEYEVGVAHNAEEALKKIFEENYMVVVSDIMMPGMSGIELLKRIKKYNGMIQVLMMTGVVTIENVLACLRNGANECYLKPLGDLEMVRAGVDEAAGKLTRWENLIRNMVKRKD